VDRLSRVGPWGRGVHPTTAEAPPRLPPLLHAPLAAISAHTAFVQPYATRISSPASSLCLSLTATTTLLLFILKTIFSICSGCPVLCSLPSLLTNTTRGGRRARHPMTTLPHRPPGPLAAVGLLGGRPQAGARPFRGRNISFKRPRRTFQWQPAWPPFSWDSQIWLFWTGGCATCPHGACRETAN